MSDVTTYDSCQYKVSSEAEFIRCNKNGIAFEVPKEIQTYSTKKIPVTSIGRNAFKSVSFQSITFAEDSNIKTFKDYSFADSKITSITFPSSLVRIRLYAFKNCIFLESVIFPESSKLETIESGSFTNTKIRHINLPNSLKDIGSNVFSKTLIRNIELPKSVRYVRENCFSDCFFLETVKFSLDSNVSINAQAFSRSTVKEIYMPKTINYLGSDQFVGCPNKPQLILPDGFRIMMFEGTVYDQLTYLRYNVFDSNEIGGFSDCQFLEDFVVPNNPDVKQVCNSAFERSSVTRIDIPDQIISIGSKAFNECKKLTKILFHENSRLTDIATQAFRKTSIRRIDIPASLLRIHASAFEDCAQLRFVNFPKQSKCHKIGDRAFCLTAIEEFHVPPLVRSIESYTFYECSNLAWLVFSKDSQCESINEYSLYGSDISEIMLPKSLTHVSQFSFTCCKNLSTIIFHPSGKLKKLDRFAVCNSPVKEILAGEQNREIIMNILELNPEISVTIINEEQCSKNAVNNNNSNRANSRVYSLQQENNDLKKRIISLYSDIKSLPELKFRVNSLENENNDLSKKCMELQSANRELQHENNALKVRMYREQEAEEQKLNFLSDHILDQTKFEVVNQIGRGRRGDVFLVKNMETGQLLAKKVYGEINLRDDDGMKFTRECEVSCSIRNPCICRFVGFCLPSSQSSASIFFEYMEGGTLQEIIDSRPSEWTSTRKAICVIEIVIGMKHLHEQGIIHRDLKPSNILCTKSLNFKISDFSESIFCDLGITMTGGVGTILFMSPEMLNDDPYDSKTDVFSFGSILFNIVTGAAPKTPLLSFLQGMRANIPEDVSPLAKSIIDKCWLYDKSARPSFSEIFDILEQNDFMIFDDVDPSVVHDKLECFIVK